MTETKKPNDPMTLLAETPQNSKAYLRNVVIKCKGEGSATDEELAHFMWRCKEMGLDPFSGQILGVIYSPGDQRKRSLSIQIPAEGFALIAERSGRVLDISEPEFDRPRDDKPPKWCKVTVKYKDLAGNERTRAWPVSFSEFKKPTDFWRDMPWHMLALRAEVHSIKRAFPGATANVKIRMDGEGQAQVMDDLIESEAAQERINHPEQKPKRKPLPRPTVSAPAEELEKVARAGG